jgi:hypothetical protein
MRETLEYEINWEKSLTPVIWWPWEPVLCLKLGRYHCQMYWCVHRQGRQRCHLSFWGQACSVALGMDLGFGCGLGVGWCLSSEDIISVCSVEATGSIWASSSVVVSMYSQKSDWTDLQRTFGEQWALIPIKWLNRRWCQLWAQWYKDL